MSKTAVAQQAITPELRQWIIAQAEAGCAVQDVLQSMRRAGWHEDVALRAMESTLTVHLQAQGLSEQDIQTRLQISPELLREPPVPDIDLSGSPLYLDLGDRRVSVLASLRSPRAVLIGGLLSDEECDALIAAAKPRMARSLTVATQTGSEEVNADRTSNGMFFQRGENELVSRIEARIARLVHWPVVNGEGIQVLQYVPGAEYKPHYDYFDPGAPGTSTILRRGGQRVGTVVMYLSEPEQGGGTTFPDVGLEVAPQRGHALFFAYARPDPSTKTLHGGAPVIAGEKWIATKWLREREFV